MRKFKEITVSVYFMTDDPAKALSISEQMQRVATGWALEGDVSTTVRVGMCEVTEEDDIPPDDEVR